MDHDNPEKTGSLSNFTENEMYQISYSMLQTSIVLFIHQSGRLIKATERFFNEFEYSPEELMKINFDMLISDCRHFERIKIHVEKNSYWEGPLTLTDKYSQKIDSIIHMSKCNQTKNYLLYIFPRNQLNDCQKLKELVYKDELTGLPNYRKFQECIYLKIDHSKKVQSKFGLIFIDVDNFKRINDQYGHLVGDKLLRECASRFLMAVKGANRVFRKSGDEFIVIVDEKDEIEKIMCGIRIQFYKEFNIEGHRIKVNISLGSGIYPDHGHYAESLINFADMEMYRTKKKNKVKKVRKRTLQR